MSEQRQIAVPTEGQRKYRAKRHLIFFHIVADILKHCPNTQTQICAKSGISQVQLKAVLKYMAQLITITNMKDGRARYKWHTRTENGDYYLLLWYKLKRLLGISEIE
jgi:predicted transcriptional regulator